MPLLADLPELDNVTSKDTILIEATPRWVPLNLAQVWQYRNLLLFLAWRDVSVRYKQTVLGAAWAIIQPLFSMILFSIFFGEFIKVPSNGVPYPLFSYAALLPWQYFSSALSSASQSLIADERLVTKIYFPRLVIPFSSVLPPGVDFIIAFVILLVLMIFYQVAPTINIIWLPLLILLAMVTALGVALWLSALNVYYRDFRYVIPFLLQFWMFASPVTYPSSVVPEKWRLLFALNPMTGVIEGFRWALLGTDTRPGPMIIVSTVVALVILISGAYYFRSVEKTFADVI
jgi:lipopolysaccharide transport system permease protein